MKDTNTGPGPGGLVGHREIGQSTIYIFNKRETEREREREREQMFTNDFTSSNSRDTVSHFIPIIE